MSDLLRFIFTTQEPFQNPRRVESLYDDLNRLKQIEPDGYKANLDAWRHALLAASKKGVLPLEPGKTVKSRFVMSTGDQLIKALDTRQFGRPQSLALVLEDAVHRRDIIPLSEFQNSQTSIYRRNWIPSIPSLGDILIWSWKQIGFGGTNDPHTLPKADWVVPENLEEISDLFLSALASSSYTPTSSIHTLSTLRATLPPTLTITDTDLSLLLRYLSRDKAALTYDPSPSSLSEPIIKLGSPPTPITEADISIATLKQTLFTLESQIPPLDELVTSLSTSARASIASKRPDAARSFLRRKNLALSTLERRRDDAHKMQEMLDTIDRARDQVAMVRAMEASATVLKELHAESGGVEHVSDVVDQLNEQVQNVEEITSIINEGVGNVVDEEEVDEEFENLLHEQAAKEAAMREIERLAREEEESRKTRERMEELDGWERHQRSSPGQVKREDEEDQRRLEEEVDRAAREVQEMHLV